MKAKKMTEREFVLKIANTELTFPEVMKNEVLDQADKLNNEYFETYLPKWDSRKHDSSRHPRDLDAYISGNLRALYYGVVKVKKLRRRNI